MKMLPALALFLALAAPGSARVGDTMADLKLRHGHPIDVEGELESPSSRWTFRDRNYVIVVTMSKNRSVREEFTKRDRRDFTLEEVQDILRDGAAPGAAWDQVSAKMWRQWDRVVTWVGRTVLVQSEGSDQ